MTAIHTAPTLGSADLVLCTGTLPNPTFSELVNAARAGGFNAISLMPSVYRRGQREEGLSDADMRNLLADNGLSVAELDPLLNWVPGHKFESADDAMFIADEAVFYEIADALGARSLNVVWALPMQLPTAQFVDAFGGVCERALAHGLLAHLEFVPWAQINTAQLALDIARQTVSPNAGVLFDSWHHFRGTATDASLAALDGRFIKAIQLNDAPALAEANVVEETMQRRLLPGEGDIDLVNIIRLLDASGCVAPIGVEVFSTELYKLSPEEIGVRAGASIRALIAKARSQ